MITRKKIRCLLIDDEPMARGVLQQHIAKVEALDLVGTFKNGMEAMEFLRDHHVDLLFLDIHMPQLLGTTLIRTLKNPTKVIFTTAYRKYAVEGFELDAVDYLLKPISFERFLKAVNKVFTTAFSPMEIEPQPAEKGTGARSPFLYFRVEKKMVKLLINDILFVEGQKDYIKIVTASRSIITKYVLSTLEEVLPSQEFLRIHKSYIVSIRKIDSFGPDTVEIGTNQLPIGRIYKGEFNRVLKSLSAP